MTTKERWGEIALNQIDLEANYPETDADLDRLKISLRKVGLLNPPWLRKRTNDQRWQVVTGARRIKAVADLGLEKIPAHLLPENTSEFHCLMVHLFDNAFTRKFNLQEQAALATQILEHCDRDTVSTTYLPFLGISPSQAHLDRLLKTATLESPWLDLAAQGRLALTAAALLADWEPQDRAAAWPYLTSLRLSQSKQEEFLEQVALLARREGLSPAAMLSREELRLALADPERSPQERTEMIRQILYRWFYPRLSAAREAFDSALGKLGWKRTSRLRLFPPAAFEGPDFRLEIKFQDAPELQQLLAEIVRLTSKEDFTDLTRVF